MLLSSPTVKEEASKPSRKAHQVGALGAVGRIGSPNLNGSQKREQKPKRYAKAGVLGLGTIGRYCKPTFDTQN